MGGGPFYDVTKVGHQYCRTQSHLLNFFDEKMSLQHVFNPKQTTFDILNLKFTFSGGVVDDMIE